MTMENDGTILQAKTGLANSVKGLREEFRNVRLIESALAVASLENKVARLEIQMVELSKYVETLRSNIWKACAP